LILAGMLAIEVRAALARRGVGCQYPLIVAAAFTGMMVWHGGLSGSAPLKVAEVGVPAPPVAVVADAPVGPETAVSRAIPPISVEHTLFSRANLLLSAVLLVGVPLVLRAVAARAVPAVDPTLPRAVPPVTDEAKHEAAQDGPSMARPGGSSTAGVLEGWAQRLDHARIVNVVLGVLLLGGVGVQIQTELRAGGVGLGLAIMRTLDLNVVNSLFLAAGLLLHPSIASYVSAVTEGGRAIVGIVVQFPLYSGLQALMFGGGLAATMSEAFVHGAQGLSASLGIPISATFPLATFLSACLVNFFVPSGGGQWIVQGPVMCAAADALGLSLPQTVMAVAYGDDVTNMVQPFWAIPLMGLTGVDVRAFMGYTALLMLLAAPAFATALVLY
jgi:short-chain fatty acids transporter